VWNSLQTHFHLKSLKHIVTKIVDICRFLAERKIRRKKIVEQGCQIFLGPNKPKQEKWPNDQFYTKRNGQENKWQWKILQNFPQLKFFVCCHLLDSHRCLTNESYFPDDSNDRKKVMVCNRLIIFNLKIRDQFNCR
jgi:hypothetical protein